MSVNLAVFPGREQMGGDRKRAIKEVATLS